MSTPLHRDTATCWYLAPKNNLLRFVAPFPFPEVVTPRKDVEFIKYERTVNGKLETLYTSRETSEAEMERAWSVVGDVSRARCPRCGSVHLHQVVVDNFPDEFPSRTDCTECQWSAPV